MTSLDPSPYLHGVLDPDKPSIRVFGDVAPRLPGDTVVTAHIAAGLRLELSGDASAIEIEYALGPRSPFANPDATPTAGVFVGPDRVDTVELAENAGHATIPLASRDPATRIRVYLPETGPVAIHSLTPVGGTIAPAPPLPRWVVYGDSITQGWTVSGTGGSWPSRVSRALDLDLVNLGYAGAARGELPTAELVVRAKPDIVTLAWGTNCWSQVPLDGEFIGAQMAMYLRTLRRGLPATPILVQSPIVRPSAEETANPVGATLRQLRAGIEAAVEARLTASATEPLRLLPGLPLVAVDELVDGIHPGDVGHERIARAVVDALASFAISKARLPGNER